jgi:hypothetical protein
MTAIRRRPNVLSASSLQARRTAHCPAPVARLPLPRALECVPVLQRAARDMALTFESGE